MRIDADSWRTGRSILRAKLNVSCSDDRKQNPRDDREEIIFFRVRGRAKKMRENIVRFLNPIMLRIETRILAMASKMRIGQFRPSFGCREYFPDYFLEGANPIGRDERNVIRSMAISPENKWI